MVSLDKTKENDALSMDGVQSVETIVNTLTNRTQPVIVAREINPKFRYTIEDMYQNELIHQKAQALANLDREMVFIGEQIQKADNGEEDKNIYYKRNNTRSYFDEYAVKEINGLLEKLKTHSVYVKVDYTNEGLKLSAEIQEKVMRDGVQQLKTVYVRPVEMSKDLVESENGYRLNISKLRDDEEAFHDKTVIKARKEQQKKEEEKAAEENEGEEEKDIKKPQPKEEQTKKEARQEVEPEKEQEQKQFQKHEQKANDVVNNLRQIKTEPQAPVVEEQDDTDYEALVLDQLISEIIAQDSDLYSQNSYAKAQIQKPTTTVLFDEKVATTPTSTFAPTQQNETFGQKVDEPRAFNVQNLTQAPTQATLMQQAQPKPQKYKICTEHEMKMDNFRRAAEEVKNKIIDMYGGDKTRAEKDETYLSLQKFVETTLEKQSQNEAIDNTKIDWNDPMNTQILQNDYQNKVSAFAKRYDEKTFDQVQNRANNPF
ncbi:MAG: hypothetical protein IJU58_03255 [Clostridia bacterium]|nr:hypothetical protein [Clostridia bacterium]